MRATLLAMLAAGLIFAAFRPPSIDYGPGLYQTRRGSIVHFDRAAFESGVADLHHSTGFATGKTGLLERRARFRVERIVPSGAEVVIISGQHSGRKGWMAAGELTLGRNGKVWKLDDHREDAR